MALTQIDLTEFVCETPGCDCDGRDGLVLHMRCHELSPPWVTYKNGELGLECSVCGKKGPSILVAEKRP